MKTIKLMNFEVSGIIETLDQNADSIINTNDTSKKLPISVLWDIDENLDKLRAINKKIIQKRQDIEKEYSDDVYSENVKAQDGTEMRRVKPEYIQEFSNKLTELMNIQNEVQIKPIDIERLEKCELVPRDYRTIRFMLSSSDTQDDDSLKD